MKVTSFTGFLRTFALIAIGGLIVLWGCSKDGDAAPFDGGAADTDTDADTDSDADTDADTDSEGSWESVGIGSAVAPDEYTVELSLTGIPPVTAAGDASSYEIISDHGDLVILDADYDQASATVTLETERQKLGISYEVEIVTAQGQELKEEFLSAETARFWVVDFASGGYAQELITGVRAEVGTHCVVYIQEGYVVAGISAAASKFDTEVHPIETNLFTDTPDMDGNSRTVILGLDGQGYYGGYFSGVNAYEDDYTFSNWGIHSNEMEIIHINVAGGDLDSGGIIIAHEFQHLLYHEAHGFTDWTYHNEGLSESAVRAVNGDYPQAIDFYFWDYQGLLGQGTSLVNWTYAQYENYVTAFLFWGYVAGQLNGESTYSDIFDLSSGHPNEVNAFLQNQLGLSMTDVQLNQMIATLVQDSSGQYGYEGFLNLGGNTPPSAASGTTSVDLEPFTGTFFNFAASSVDYPGTEGPNIVYAGIDSAGNVDLTAPFDVDGGALLVMNTNFEYSSYPSEHSGPDLAASGGSKGVSKGATPVVPVDVFDGVFPATWFDPPPYNPYRPEEYLAWKARTDMRIAALEGP